GRAVEVEIRRGENLVHGAADGRVTSGQLGEGGALELLPEVDTVRAVQVVEPIAVLKVFQLLLEDDVERRPQQTAEHVRLLSHSTGPVVDVVETAGRGGLGQE